MLSKYDIPKLMLTKRLCLIAGVYRPENGISPEELWLRIDYQTPYLDKSKLVTTPFVINRTADRFSPSESRYSKGKTLQIGLEQCLWVLFGKGTINERNHIFGEGSRYLEETEKKTNKVSSHGAIIVTNNAYGVSNTVISKPFILESNQRPAPPQVYFPDLPTALWRK